MNLKSIFINAISLIRNELDYLNIEVCQENVYDEAVANRIMHLYSILEWGMARYQCYFEHTFYRDFLYDSNGGCLASFPN